MIKKEIGSNFILFLAALIWGLAFVAQKLGAELIGPFTFNGIRFALGALSLLPVIAILKKIGLSSSKASFKKLLAYGTLCGSIMFVASWLQQSAMKDVDAGKAGFITGFYIVLVPLFGLFLKQKTNLFTWIGAALAVTGLYFLNVNENMSLNFSPGILALLISSFLWAAHIICIDHCVQRSDALRLSCVQCFVCSALSMICAFIFESVTLASIKSAAVPIAYGGFFSVGLAYTFQVIGQKNSRPAVAAIVLSLESVTAAIGGALMLKESLGARGVIGCVLIFAGIIASQLKTIALSEAGIKNK